ncbi:piggyBac transposable element-derived protein 4-like [Scylla paramamosain]|uniref:piggyBac transposable element-derived protein 4-like n=1 Tax=Scylla paramamosain TaxID=85552 RepID=UPI00308308B9
MFPSRRRITDDDIQLILSHDLDDEFMDAISSDAESASGSDDDDDTASGDDSQPNIVEEADDSLSDGEAGGYDNSVSVGWMSQSPVSREQLTFTRDMGVISNYIPKENISSDDSLLLWKGRLSWKRYIPLKRARFGMETYILAESESGYVWDVLPYTGRRTQHDCQIPGLSDQDVTKLSITRKGIKKYYKKIFLRLIEMTLHNCHIIYKRNDGQKKTLDFKLLLIEQIVHTYGKDVYWIKKPTSSVTLGPCPTILSGRHFPIETLSAEGDTTKKVQRICTYCAMQKKVKRSIYNCDICQVSLCITPCFKLYHT